MRGTSHSSGVLSFFMVEAHHSVLAVYFFKAVFPPVCVCFVVCVIADS